MSGELKIRWSGGERTFQYGSTIRIGRDPDCDLQIANPNVSRVHARLGPGPGRTWMLADAGSSQGIFHNGNKIAELPITSSESIVLGLLANGERLELSVETSSAATHVGSTKGDPGEEDTVLPGERRPGGALRSEVLDGATVVAGQTIKVECAGKSYQFSPGRSIVIGRDKKADVVSANPTVSREHARLRHDGTSWLIEDADSAGGTFIDGERVTSHKLRGSTAVFLGDQTAGERIVFVTSGSNLPTPKERLRRSWRTNRVPVLAALLAIAVVAVGVFAVWPKEPDLDRLVRGVVMIRTNSGSGSGTVIDAEEGLILTNAHVAAPHAPGLSVESGILGPQEEPEFIDVWLSPGLDVAAEPRYQAEVVAADGYLDLAVIRITRTISGAIIDQPTDLVEIPIGSSDSVGSGDEVLVIGFPGVAGSGAATITTGVISSPVQDNRLNSNRAYINMTADINPGNSGGLAADSSGRIVGVPTINRLSELGPEVASMRPINFADALIESARSGEPYSSAYVQVLTGPETITDVTFASGTSAFEHGCSAQGAAPAAGDREVGLAITYEGFQADAHQDFLVLIWDPATGRELGRVATASQWPFEWDEAGCVTVRVSLASPLQAGEYGLDFYAGPSYELLDEFTFQVG